MDRLKRLFIKIVYPNIFLSALVILLGFGLLIYTFSTKQVASPLAYIAYALSAYALVLIVMNAVPLIWKSRKWLENNKHTNRYLYEAEYRARVSLNIGLIINLAYVVLKAVSGIYYRSVWLGMVAVYYIVLSSIRFFLARSNKKSLTVKQSFLCYRFTGVLMLFLNLTMSGMIVQMLWQNKGYSYPGFIIYASAAYTFYAVVIAIVNVIRYHRLDPILSATKMISFVAALMSLFTLQTALITQFGEGNDFRGVMNTVTGSAVAVLTVGFAVFMIVRANKALNRL